MAGALEGIRILEFSEIIAAPFAGMLLSDMGANVIKVEPTAGEAWRLSAQFMPGESRQFISLNRGKRGLAIDLKTAEGREVIHKLVPSMDVVVVNYRPDTPYNLGIDYETLSALNPRLIYVENTAFGRKGPHSYRPGYDIIAQAVTGLMAANGKTNDKGLPQAMSPAMADFSTGISICWAVCAALFARERTGKGQKVEASLLGTALAVQTGTFMEIDSVDADTQGVMRQRLRELRESGASFEEIQKVRGELRPQFGAGNAYYRCYFTKDSVVAVGCLSDALRRKAAAAMGVSDPRFDDPNAAPPMSPESRAAAAKVVEAAEAIMRTKTTDEWVRIFDSAGVPAGPYRTIDELRTDPQVLENDLVVELEHSLVGHLKMVGPPLKFSETPSQVQSASPALGEHNDEVLSELGYDAAAIASMRERGIVK
jgi:crotonobetainyl-CoA:carnitine CoA-transferase CaiB-like acyl-CoA transferase